MEKDANKEILKQANKGAKDKDYPAWRYSAAEPAGRRVVNKDEDDALGAGWYDSPDKLPKAEPPSTIGPAWTAPAPKVKPAPTPPVSGPKAE